MSFPRSFACLVTLYCLNFQPALRAQEGAGQAETSFQQYYLAVGPNRIANISGLGLSFTQFLPEVGLISGSLLPATNNAHFRTGDTYVRLKGLPWRGRHWTFTAGDFRMPGQLLAVPFSNIASSELAARGAAVEATHGTQTLGFFFGQGTISNTPRVLLREEVPQRLVGAYWRRRVGRLLLGARLLHFSNNLAELRNLPTLVSQVPIASATTASISSLYNLAGPLKVYGEATWSTSAPEDQSVTKTAAALSTVSGPVVDTKRFTFRANYTLQSASYFPLLGYYLGDRKGPFSELRYRPFERLEFYASASEYENNVAHNPRLATFQNTSQSVGASLQLPGKIAINSQFTKLELKTRESAQADWLRSADRQTAITITRPFSHQNLRVTVRDFQDVSPLNFQRQRTAELEDNVHLKRMSLGGGVRLQRMTAVQSRTSVFYRGTVQVQIRRLSAYANFEAGNDLLNRTLLATNTVSTTVFGASASLGKNWEFQAEAYRNNLLTELNPQSIFVLQGQGISVPGTLAALNQWSIYFRLTRRFHWGTANIVGDIAQYAARRTLLKGSIEGFVMEHLAGGNQPAEGVTVTIDQGVTSLTDKDGHFRFPEVPEGPHRVALAPHELPAEFDLGKNVESAVVVSPSKVTRTDFDVVRLSFIQGKIIHPKDVSTDAIVIRLLPGTTYTTADEEGNFALYNVRAGSYTVSLDEKTLPEFAVLSHPATVSISVPGDSASAPIEFGFTIHKPEKPTRNVLEKK